MRSEIAACACVLGMVVCASGAEPEWGHLRGRFVWNGKLPAVSQQGATPSADPSLMIDAKSRGIANVLVYLSPRRGQEVPEHPSYAKTRAAKVEWKMEQMRFVPRVLLLRTSQTMVQRNLDGMGHNAHIAFIRNAPM